jgi:zinc transport system ATP-binding protein
VISDLDFSVAPGDFLLIAGENGSGKSTLVQGLLRLLPPLGGSITHSIRPSRIGYLAQQTAAKQDFPAGVFEIVLSGNLGKKGLFSFYNRAEKQRAAECLAMLEIQNLRERCFRELSGGQQRRVMLARSLCAADALLVLDEPFAGLDPLISAELCRLLDKIKREMGMTIIMVSHTTEAVASATHVLHVQNRQLFFGGAGEYRQSELGRQFFQKRGGMHG